MSQYTESIARLINELTKLPGIGEKTAQRLTFFLLKAPGSDVKGLAKALVDVKDHAYMIKATAAAAYKCCCGRPDRVTRWQLAMLPRP